MDEDNNKNKYKKADDIKGVIEFRDVWFRYPTRKEDFVLRGLNLTINPNEQVALVGESGCGKSTFVNLLMRFYDVDFGEILLDGTNIKEYNLHSLRQQISLVMQEPIIFNYSILENILYGKLNAYNTEVLEATGISNCDEFIQNESINAVDNTPKSILHAMEERKEELIKVIGQDKYDEEIAVMQKCVEQESKKGMFEAIDGDVDNRDMPYKNEALVKGFGTQCGIKGSKLSGGQK